MVDKDQDQQAAFGRIVDRLLKKLPGADPMLRGDQARVNVSGVPHVPHASHADKPASPRARFAVWGRVGLGLILGVVVNLWPYGRDCGLGLVFYLVAVGAVFIGGVWGAVSAWDRRMGVAHIVALLLIAWGAALAAERILPRVGYAAVAAGWRCS